MIQINLIVLVILLELISFSAFGMAKKPTQSDATKKCGYIEGRYLLKASELKKVCRRTVPANQEIQNWPYVPTRLYEDDTLIFTSPAALEGPAELILDIKQLGCNDIVLKMSFRKEDPIYFHREFHKVHLSRNRVEYGFNGDKQTIDWIGEDDLATLRIRGHQEANDTGYPACDRNPYGFNDAFRPRTLCPPRDEDIELSREPWGDLHYVYRYQERGLFADSRRTIETVCSFPVVVDSK